MDLVDKIITYENGKMDTEDTIAFFQELIDNGMAWTLQGHYGRAARELIERGLCTFRKPRGGSREITAS